MDTPLPLLLIMAALLLAGGCLQQTADVRSLEETRQIGYDAIADLDREIEADPENATAWCTKGMYLNNIDGQYNASLECYDRALALDPDYALAWYAKGIALWNLGDDGGADGCFEKAVGLDRSLAPYVPSRPDTEYGASAVSIATGD
ncbi:tetratricopeptide repeat protein [uncultured Methanofollis sp.]|uniref:tetratricopeptide repeat protein n=1 Tax=uncultured Methanofollis sp. TaxID=262500 RepID=UPI00262520AE|nr:tetratricopeptide repeat protein [uncultured Methanofollis sp.]